MTTTTTINVAKVLCSSCGWLDGAVWADAHKGKPGHLALSVEYAVPVMTDGGHDGPSFDEARVHTGATVHLD